MRSLLLLILLPMAQALTAEVEILDIIKEDLSLDETISAKIQSAGNFSLVLPATATEITLDSEPVGNNVTIDCQDCVFELSYMLDGVVKKDNSNLVFSRTVNLPINESNFIYEVQLPQGKILHEDPLEPAVVPTPKSITTDGQAIIIIWSAQNTSFPQRYFIRYTSPTEPMDIKNELTEPAVWVLIVVALLIGAGIGFYIRTCSKKPVVLSSLLTPDEQAIVKAIEDGNQMQKEIVKTLGWSKSKVSGVMSNLEYKKLIKKEKIGRTFKVQLLSKVNKQE